METINDHYGKILGLELDWKVSSVDLNLQNNEVSITVEHTGKSACCSKCGKNAGLYDHSPERTWRHLDTMQCMTYLRTKTPRVECATHGVTTAQLPWAGKHSRFTLFFEAFAIQVLQMAKSKTDACKLLRLGWEQLQAIMNRAVQRGLERRDGRATIYL